MDYLEYKTSKGIRRMELRDKPLTIGRHTENKLSFNDDRLSRFHAIVEKTPEGVYLRDLGSRNGTAVNGLLVKEQRLEPGDEIRIGGLQLIYGNGKAPVTKVKHVAIGAKPVSDSLAADAPHPHSSSTSIAPPKWEMPSNDIAGMTPAKQLASLAESLPNRPFTAHEIELINVRGEVSHPVFIESNNIKDVPSEAVTIWRLILLCCFRSRASDIHVEPKNETFVVRIRADGSMIQIATLKKDLGVRMLSVVKILCDIDISVRNEIQEGSFTSRIPDRRVDYRVSLTPSLYGQKLVVRCLDSANSPKYLWDLSLPEIMFRNIEKAIKRDAGMLLVCGPTGSGKTSTLYSVLRSIDASERNVVTIEDPVEIQIEGVTQMPVNDEAGSTFPNLLRSVLRQDPDVILVGEIRDAETARVAMQAAMTGHLVFSTVHAKDGAGSIFRLLDLGIEPFLVASGLNQLLSQRLVRVLCPFCKVSASVTDEQLRDMGEPYQNLNSIYRAQGCQKCLGTGYAGRRGVFELLSVDDGIRAAIATNNQAEVSKALFQAGHRTLRHHGWELVATGLTSFDEVDRVVGD